MIIYDLKYFDGLLDGLRVSKADYRSDAYQLAMEIYKLRNIRKCPHPPKRNWDRRNVLKQFRAAVTRAGSAKDLLEKMLTPTAKKAVTDNEYWIAFADEGMGYCGDCIDFAVRRERKSGNREARRDGGWGNEVDYPSFCECCHKYLDETILQWEEELARYAAMGIGNDPVDHVIVLNCISAAEDDDADVRRIALWYYATTHFAEIGKGGGQ